MCNLHRFDYDVLTCDTLSGIYVEVNDSGPDTCPDSLSVKQAPSVAAELQQRFGLTLSVDDDRMGERSSPIS